MGTHRDHHRGGCLGHIATGLEINREHTEETATDGSSVREGQNQAFEGHHAYPMES